jgi:hypothetical protein
LPAIGSPPLDSIRELDLTAEMHEQLVGKIKTDRGPESWLWSGKSRKLKKLQEGPLKLDESKKLKLRLREIEKELGRHRRECGLSPQPS